MRKLWLFILISVLALELSAQEKPVLKILSDSIYVGQPFGVSLCYKHSIYESITFPDSSYDFSPFEFEKKQYFKTYTIDSISTDSAIYWLSTFELEALQTLKLPIFIHGRKDTIKVFSNADSVVLITLIKPDADSLNIKQNTEYVEVKKDFNVLLFSIILSAIVFILLTLLIIFRKKIAAYFRVKKLSKSHSAFLVKFEKLKNKFLSEKEIKMLEKLNALARHHLELLLNQPISKMSTKELSTLVNADIYGHFREIDAALYGNIQLSAADETLKNLEKYIEDCYRKKLEIVREH